MDFISRCNHALTELKKKYYKWRIMGKARKVGDGFNVGGKSYVTDNTWLGNNVNFNGMAMSGKGRITIGDNFHSGPNCQIITSFHNYEGEAIPYDDTFWDKDVVIDENVWIGNNVIILGGVHIEEGAIIQAGSVVCRSIPRCAICGGHPAVPFKYRNQDHYEAMKLAGKFH